MTLRRSLRCLLLLVLALPLLQATLMWAGGLLASMGDQSAATVLRHVNTAAGVAWLVCLVGLLVALAIDAVSRPTDEGDRTRLRDDVG